MRGALTTVRTQAPRVNDGWIERLYLPLSR